MDSLISFGGLRDDRRRRTPLVLAPMLVALLAVGACSGDADHANLRPPSEWRAGFEDTARNAAGQARGVSLEALRRSPAVTGPALVQAIRFSRAQAMAKTPQAMPDQIRTALAPYFSDEILDAARWTTAGRDLGLGSLLARWYYEEGTVTLQDVIVFSDAAVAENVWLWAHELAHMEQYRRLGTDGFAARYASDWRGLEAEANRRAFAITADIRARRAARPSTVTTVMESIADMLDLSAPGSESETVATPAEIETDTPPASDTAPTRPAGVEDSAN